MAQELRDKLLKQTSSALVERLRERSLAPEECDLLRWTLGELETTAPLTERVARLEQTVSNLSSQISFLKVVPQ